MQMMKEYTLVLPSHPPFLEDHSLSLSHIDSDPNLTHTFRFLRAYTTTTTTHTHNNLFHVISSSLSKTLLHYYPLAATLRRRQYPDRRLELWCTAGQGIPLIHATVDFTLDSVNYLSDPTFPFIEHFVPKPTPEEGMKHPCILQLTVFKCGGFTLGAAINHSLCDALGANHFFNAWAELARGSTKISMEPVWDRERLLGPRNPPRVDSPFIGEFLSLEDKGFSPDNVGGFVRECFHVRDESLDEFKRSLFHQSGFNFTTFEALAAYIWKSKIRASGVMDNEKVKLEYSINIRRLVQPPLPTGYWGNSCVPVRVQLSANDLIQRPIWKIAELIKMSKSNVNDAYVRSFIDYKELHYDEGLTSRKMVTRFMDWRHLGHSTVDFGWGGPVTILPLRRTNNDPCFFLPYSTTSGAAEKKEGFKVLVTLTEAALPAFREDMQLFNKYSIRSPL